MMHRDFGKIDVLAQEHKIIYLQNLNFVRIRHDHLKKPVNVDGSWKI